MYDELYDQQSNPPRKISARTWMDRMRRDREYADDILIRLTANWLKRKILILPWNENEGPLDPFQFISIEPVDGEGRDVDAEGMYYLLYYPDSWLANGSHYQSIMPIDQSDSDEPPIKRYSPDPAEWPTLSDSMRKENRSNRYSLCLYILLITKAENILFL